MGAEVGRAQHPLTLALLERGQDFSFQQAVRLLQLLHPDATPVGLQGPPDDEVVRFSGWLSLAFPPGDVASVASWERIPDGLGNVDARPRFSLEATFLGLYGSSSPLPTCYTEELLDQEDPEAERAFYDLFQHRLISMVYRSWERYRIAARFRPDGEDYYSQRLGRLVHVSEREVPEGSAMPRLELLALAGLLSQGPRSAASLSAALRASFDGVEFKVESFIPRWQDIPRDQYSRLGTENSILGQDLLLGSRIRDMGGTFRVVVDTTGFADYADFLPGGRRFQAAREVIDLFNSDALDYELEVRLPAAGAPPFALGTQHARLGWSTWLGRPDEVDCQIRLFFEGAQHGGH
ncbi:MAG: type VI secretion system baseplate subunit TssG [Planctomycetota bacterium]